MKNLLQICLLCLLMLSSTIALASMPEKPPVNPTQAKDVKTVESLNDGASLLKSTEAQQLNSKIKKLESKYGVKIAIVTTPTIQNQEPARVADLLLSSNFNTGRNGNIILLISMDTREWHIATDAAMSQMITNSAGLPYIENAFLSKLSDGNYSGALNSYVDSVDELLGYYLQNEVPYDPSTGFNPMAAIAAVVISIFIGTMIRSSLIASMSNVRPAIEASEYLDKNSLQLTENRDTFLYMNVQRRPKSHGGGGHNSGGNSSGGGGRGGSF